MSDVYMVWLTAEQRLDLMLDVRRGSGSPLEADLPSRFRALESARPEHPEWRAALEELVKRALAIDEAEGERAQRRAWIELRMAANRLRSLEGR